MKNLQENKDKWHELSSSIAIYYNYKYNNCISCKYNFIYGEYKKFTKLYSRGLFKDIWGNLYI